MGDEERNDYDAIANNLREIEDALISGTHPQVLGDSVTTIMSAWIITVTKLKWLENYVSGLADSHRE